MVRETTLLSSQSLLRNLEEEEQLCIRMAEAAGQCQGGQRTNRKTIPKLEAQLEMLPPPTTMRSDGGDLHPNTPALHSANPRRLLNRSRMFRTE